MHTNNSNDSRRASVDGGKPHKRQKSLEVDSSSIQLTRVTSAGSPSEASLVPTPSHLSSISTPADPHVPPAYGHDAQFVPVQPVYYDGPAAGGGIGHPVHHDATTLTFTPISQ